MYINEKQWIENAKQMIVKLICGNDLESSKNLLSYFNEVVTISFDGTSDNINFAAHATGSLKHKFNENGELLVQSSNILLRLPKLPNPNSPQINGWMVDVHHELFHAFTKLMSGIKKCENKGDIYYAPSGGKISILQYANGIFSNRGDVPFTVLFNELVTDIIAYASTYKSIDGIIYSHDLERIDDRYGHYNGYYELLQLGLVIFNSFSNYFPNYDTLVNKGIFGSEYDEKIDTQNCYYNDLLYGVLMDPMHIKIQFLKYCSEDDWDKLNESSSLVLKDFQNGRKINKDGIKTIMKILKIYFDNKIENMTDKLDPIIIEGLRKKFNERFESARSYYNVSLEQNQNSIRGFIK